MKKSEVVMQATSFLALSDHDMITCSLSVREQAQSALLRLFDDDLYEDDDVEYLRTELFKALVCSYAHKLQL